MTLHVFAMDGTLLPGTTASLQIARHLGCAAELAGLEARSGSGAVDTRGFARELLAFGFDEVAASRFPALPFREPLDPPRYSHPRR